MGRGRRKVSACFLPAMSQGPWQKTHRSSGGAHSTTGQGSTERGGGGGEGGVLLGTETEGGMGSLSEETLLEARLPTDFLSPPPRPGVSLALFPHRHLVCIEKPE